MNTPEKILTSPWGPVQTQGQVAPGIRFVNTAGHGGLMLSLARVDEMRERLPGFSPFAGWPWLEEDCDAAAAPLVWPEYYTSEERRAAVRMFLNPGPALINGATIQTFLQCTQNGRGLVIEAKSWELANAEKWETGGGSTTFDGWSIILYRISDKVSRQRWFAAYPTQTLYTSEELHRLSKSIDEARAAHQAAQAPRRQTRELARAYRGPDYDLYDIGHSDADPGL